MPVLVNASTSTVTSAWVRINQFPATYEAYLSDTTTPAATVYVEGRLDDGTGVSPSSSGPAAVIDVLSLSGAKACIGGACLGEWDWMRFRVSALTGTSAAVTCTVNGSRRN